MFLLVKFFLPALGTFLGAIIVGVNISDNVLLEHRLHIFLGVLINIIFSTFLMPALLTVSSTLDAIIMMIGIFLLSFSVMSRRVTGIIISIIVTLFLVLFIEVSIIISF